MTTRAKHIFIGLWMSTLLIASVGVSAHKVYCYCVGESTVSFFVAEDACQMEGSEAGQADCCAPKNASTQASCCAKPDEKEHDGCSDCTQKTTVVFKLKTESEPCVSCFKKLELPKNWAIAPKPFPSHPPLAATPPATAAHLFERPPPPLAGKALCIRYGVFRC